MEVHDGPANADNLPGKDRPDNYLVQRTRDALE
jgi:hypothetical protein